MAYKYTTTTKRIFMITASTLAALSLTGCLLMEDGGTTETSAGNPVTTPPDFQVHDDNPATPPTGGDNTTQTTPTNPDIIEEGFVINEGATKTKDPNLTLRMITLNRFEMKISTDLACTGGTWQPWSETIVIPTPLPNAVNMITVQYKDWDQRITRCYRQSILHDAKGPDILFTKYPLAQLEEGSTADIAAEVTDTASTVTSVTCSMNGISKSCFPGRNEVSISQLPVGTYGFTISATDDLGNASTKTVNWTVVSTTRHLAQNVIVNNYKKVDILIVIDNSGSMEYEQQSMGQRTSNLLSVIRGLDYQIAVTTTDPRDVTLGDGRFVPISGTNNQYIMDSSTAESTNQQRLSATLQRPETGSGSEQAIRVTTRVVERYNANDSKARAFFREGAQFAVLVISDEDESDNGVKNDPQNLLGLIHSSFGGQKMFGFHSIITKPGDTACRSTNGYSYGDRYDAFSRLTGGVIGSVCATDYASQVTGIAQGIRDLLKTMTLQCSPLPNFPITVKKDGVAISNTFAVNGVNLKFDTELEPGNYTVDYQCLK